MTDQDRAILDDPVWEAGAVRLIRAESGDPETRAALLAWIGEDGARLAVVERMRSEWQAALALASDPGLADIRSEARAFLHRSRYRRTAFMRSAWAMAAGFALIVIAAAAIVFRPQSAPPVTIANAEEGVRTIRLADGSTVALDHGAAIQVDFSRSARRVSLVRGQARFKIAHDAARPFDVVARNRDIRALGTDFNVDAAGDGLTVSLIEGRVRVVRLTQQPQWFGLGKKTAAVDPVMLRAGQQLIAPPGGQTRVAAFRAEEVTAWQRGLIILDDRPLADALALVNRYADVKLRLDATVPQQFRISGTFAADDAAGFAENLTLLYPRLKVRREKQELVIFRPSSS